MTELEILGVKITNISELEVYRQIKEWIDKGGKYQIVTTNSEFILLARENLKFKEVINTSSLSLPDGSGVIFAARYFDGFKKLKKNWLRPFSAFLLGLRVWLVTRPEGLFPGVMEKTITGIDLMEGIVDKFGEWGNSFYLVGTKYQDGSESAKDAARALVKRKPAVKIVGNCSGREELAKGNFDFCKPEEVVQRIHSDLSASGLESIDFLFVAFGQMLQELWIKENMPRIPAKVFVGVGGSFDFVSGKHPRAPRFLREMNLEWLFRLVTNFSFVRMVRVFRAAVVFPLTVYLTSLKETY